MSVDWPSLRAAMLSMFVVGNLLQALPFPTEAVDPKEAATWRAHDVSRWHGWLTAAGIYRGDGERFQADVVAGYGALAAVGAVIQGPSRPVFRFLRSTQQWGLFGVVTEVPERLLVEVRVDDTWVLIEQRLDPKHSWNDDIFKYRRVRGTWDTFKKGDKSTPLYESFCRWTARRAFADYPRADRVRITRERVPVAAPWETLTIGVERLHERELSRDDALLWVLR